MPTNLPELFGPIDIYLFDQLLRGRITPGMRILDVGCGHGRNLIYLLKEGYDLYAIDQDPDAIGQVRTLAHFLAPNLPATNFRTEPIDHTTLPAAFADVILCNAVLHFARDHAHFTAMVQSIWRILRPNGLLFCRLASSIGIEHQIQPISAGRFELPDGSDRYLVDEAQLLTLTADLGGELLDPLRTTIVQNQRSMTTWVVRKLG